MAELERTALTKEPASARPQTQLQPSSKSTSALARRAKRCAADPLRAKAIKSARSSGDKKWARIMHPTRILKSPNHKRIVEFSLSPSILEEKSATPIVFVSVFDPIDAKFVSNLARPGGRITGFTNHERSMGGKWLQILKEIRRKAGRRFEQGAIA